MHTSKAPFARVALVRSSVRAPQTVAVSPAGTFQVAGLPMGQYKLCTAPPDGFLDNCTWGSMVDVLLAPGTAAAAVRNIRLKQGAIVRIRVDDPQSLLASVETSGGARAHIGVMTSSNAFRPAEVRSRDASGRNLVLTVPFDTPLRLWVNPNKIGIRGPDGTTFLSHGAAALFQTSRLAGDVSFHLQVVPDTP